MAIGKPFTRKRNKKMKTQNPWKIHVRQFTARQKQKVQKVKDKK